MIFKYRGSGIRSSVLQKDWEIKQIKDYNEYGCELLWPYEDITIDKECKANFFSIIGDYWKIRLDIQINTNTNQNLLILPHHNKLNILMPQMIETDWFSEPIEIIFCADIVEFKNKEPIAQIISVPRADYVFREMSDKEYKFIQKSYDYIQANKNKYITRKNNYYEVLSNLAERNQLPQEIRPNKIPLGSKLYGIVK